MVLCICDEVNVSFVCLCVAVNMKNPLMYDVMCTVMKIMVTNCLMECILTIFRL